MKHPDELDRLLVAVDCIIISYTDRRLQTLMVRRVTEPHLGKTTLMGGIVDRDESIDAAAARVLRELTGLESVYLEQLRAFGEVDRDDNGDGERSISVSYYSLVRYEDATAQLTDKYNPLWYPLDELPSLAFDHAKMVQAAIRRLRFRAAHEPVVFNLLPEKFTLIDLQAVYESLFGRRIDAGNFRRRLRKMDYLVRLPEKDSRFSRKGAFYYRFDRGEYEEATANGHDFLLKP